MGKHLAFLEREKILSYGFSDGYFTGSNRWMYLHVLFPRDTAFLLILLAWQTVVKRFLDRDTYSSEVSFHSMNDTHYLLYFNKIRFPEAYLADVTE